MAKRKRAVEFIENDVKRFKALQYKRVAKKHLESKRDVMVVEKQEALQVLMEKMFKRVKQLEDRIVQLEEMIELDSYDAIKHIYF